MSIEASSFISFQSQPDFPNEDIHEHNALLASHYLTTFPDGESYTDTHQETLKVLHEIGNSALAAANVSPGNTRGEYQAFCHRFTTIDYIATLLDSRPFAQIRRGNSMQHFFMEKWLTSNCGNDDRTG